MAVLRQKNIINLCSEFSFSLSMECVFRTVIGVVYRVFSMNRVHFLFLSVCTCDHLPGRGSFVGVQRGRPMGRTSGPELTLGTCLDTHTHPMKTSTFRDVGFIDIYANVGIEHFETGLQLAKTLSEKFRVEFQHLSCVCGWGGGM